MKFENNKFALLSDEKSQVCEVTVSEKNRHDEKFLWGRVK
jgi:hypothetical protein